MNDQDRSSETHTPADAPNKNWIAWCVEYVKRKFEQRRANKQNENAPDRAGRRTANATVVIAFLTFVMAVVGAAQWTALHNTDEKIGKQIGVMQGQLAEMKSSGKQTDDLIAIYKQLADATKTSAEISGKSLIAANRPWIKVDIGVGGPITYDVNGVNFNFKFVLKNIGHSPATNVWVNPKAFLTYVTNEPGDRPKVFDARIELLKDIAERKKQPPSPFGFAMFPDDVITQEISTSISKEEIARATTLIKALYPVVYGIVEYRTGFDSAPRHTGFIFEIRRDDKPRPFTIEGKKFAPAIWVDEGDVPASEIRLWRSITEGGYAD